MSDSCPSEELLSCFHDGELSEEESQSVRRHLVSCQACRELLESFSRLDRCLSEEQFAVGEPSLRIVPKRRWRKAIPLAFAASLALLALPFLRPSTDSSVKVYQFSAESNYQVRVEGEAQLVSLQMGDIKMTYKQTLEE